MNRHGTTISSQLGQTSWGLREEPNSIYGDRAVSSIDFYAGVAIVAIITGFYFPHGLTDQCPGLLSVHFFRSYTFTEYRLTVSYKHLSRR
ncbi:MAG: hypothetical protein RLZZ435_945 [Cyanobacteriota bacterium]|jgi:hypothetical protein